MFLLEKPLPSETKIIQPQKIESFSEETKEKKVFLSSPLQLFQKRELGVLTKEGILELTNKERENYGLSPLKENPTLDLMAEEKARDILERQYFDHISPDGKGVGDLAKDFQYNYLIIGENLAMGDFETEESLISAWMESPGHRENILNPKYQEIGIGVRKGTFQGKEVWVAVCHFGTPLSACPQPDSILREKIEILNKDLNEEKKELESLKSEIEDPYFYFNPNSTQVIEKYNLLVNDYNLKVKELKDLIKSYNSQVELFNQCLSSFSQD